jgi:competence protein ComEC
MLIRFFVWKKAPFLRFLLPFMAGIILQWNVKLPIEIAWSAFSLSLFFLLFFFILPRFDRYKLAIPNGIAITIIFLALGSFLVWYKDIRHNPHWYSMHYKAGDLVIATLKEPLVEKTNSYKALATVTGIKEANRIIPVKGDLLLYFKKDTSLPTLDFGSQIIFSKPLQEIKNAGNPGGFDYKRYCLFQDITHQVYLIQGEFVVLNKKNQSLFGKILFPVRQKILSILRMYIPGEKEQCLAEALLVGYKNDLDKDLVQSYTNTGVVHIIAISGLHLGLIYWLLVLLFKPLRKKKVLKWLSPIIIISGLWLFSLLAGAQPSVLRSALMFTCIVFAENLSRKTSIYNTLALSAFVLLCINPFSLWDVGFQLSYSAVLSIVIFMQPIYNWFFIKNKLVDFIWKLNAISMAAQLLTTPFSIYHFHQFPNFFLLTNFIAVPLSSLIVLGEIFICALSFVSPLAIIAGKLLSWLIWLMNSYIERIGALPGSLWDGIQINMLQACLLLLAVAGLGYWLLEKQRKAAWICLVAVLGFMYLRSFSFYECGRQRKIIVYNVAKHQAIDILDGRNYFFIGDNDLLTDEFTRNFNLTPSRVLHRLKTTDTIHNFCRVENCIAYGSKRILLIDRTLVFFPVKEKITVDLVIISKNSRLYLSKLVETFTIKQIVFDGSVPRWKLKRLSADCDSLHICRHDVSEKGAFVMSLD